MSDGLFDLMVEISKTSDLASEIPSLEEWSKRVDHIKASVSLTACPSCGGQPLIDVDKFTARCRCGWTGRVLRRLP